VRRAGLPDPQPQAVLSDADGVIGRVDWLVPSFRLVLECDSFEWHGAWHRRKADLRRDRRLVAAGYVVLRFSWEDVTRRQQQVLADLVGAASRLAA
jgi:very-short-patch-repair endonuclease